jgi:HTH-type transcriptional regulator/antitoxin HigA
MNSPMSNIVIKPIKTEADYDAALEQIALLMDAKAGTPEADELEVLATLVECYETEHYPINLPDPIAAIRFRMEQEDLSQRDLIPYIGSRSKVSEVLSGKRPLTLQMMRSLHQHLGIPADVLLQEQGATLPDNPESLDWTQYPIKAMAKLGWVSQDAGDRAEEIMRSLIERAGGKQTLVTMLCRQNEHIRRNGQMDMYALQAWGLQLITIARETNLLTKYKSGTLTTELAQKMVRLSWAESAPSLAKEFLAQYGIHLIYLPHLPRTHLDGAALRLDDGTPVIGLTLRHDRLDNFWFSLCHELAHQSLHLENNISDAFFEDLSVEAPTSDIKEREADAWASNVLIPDALWQSSQAATNPTPANVLKFARDLGIHPAIIAGRIRKETGNYRLLTNYVGHGEVRKLFANI